MVSYSGCCWKQLCSVWCCSLHGFLFCIGLPFGIHGSNDGHVLKWWFWGAMLVWFCKDPRLLKCFRSPCLSSSFATLLASKPSATTLRSALLSQVARGHSDHHFPTVEVTLLALGALALSSFILEKFFFRKRKLEEQKYRVWAFHGDVDLMVTMPNKKCFRCLVWANFSSAFGCVVVHRPT